MATKKKKTLLYVVGSLVLLTGAYLALKPQEQTPPPFTPPPPPTGGPSGSGDPAPGTIVIPPPPPPAAPLKVGDKVNARIMAPGYITEWRGSAYTEGGSNKHGQIEPGKYAGIITKVSTTAPGSVKVSNYTNNMKAGSVLVYDFWMNKNDLIKA